MKNTNRDIDNVRKDMANGDYAVSYEFNFSKFTRALENFAHG